MSDEPGIQPFVDAVNEASKRARQIVYILVTAGIVFFAAYWNSKEDNWTDDRIAAARNALRWSSVSNRPSGDDGQLFDNAKEWIKAKQLTQSEEVAKYINKYIDDMEHIKREQVNLVRIPVFGVVFDVNDLGIIGGVTFIVILITLRYTLVRALENVKIAFQQAKKRDQEAKYYDLLSTGQVLTTPPQKGEVEKGFGEAAKELLTFSRVANQARKRFVWRKWFWRFLLSFIISFPLIVQLLVTWNDLRTWDIGSLLHKSHASFVLIGEMICFGLIVILTFLCYKLLGNYNAEWKKQAENLVNNPNQEDSKESHNPSTSSKTSSASATPPDSPNTIPASKNLAQFLSVGVGAIMLIALAGLFFVRTDIRGLERVIVVLRSELDELKGVLGTQTIQIKASQGPKEAGSIWREPGSVEVTAGHGATSAALLKPLALEEELEVKPAGFQTAQLVGRLPPGVTFTPYKPFPINSRMWIEAERAGIQAEESGLDPQIRDKLKAEREALAVEFRGLLDNAKELAQLWGKYNLEGRTSRFAEEYWNIKDLADDWLKRVDEAKAKCNRTVPPEEYEKLLKECKQLERTLESERQTILARDRANIDYFNVVVLDSQKFGKQELAHRNQVETWHQRIGAYADEVAKAKPTVGNRISIHVQRVGESGSGTRLFERKGSNVDRSKALGLADQLKADVERGMRPAERSALDHAIERVKRWLRNHSQPPGLFHTGPEIRFGPDNQYRIDVEISGTYPYPGDA